MHAHREHIRVGPLLCITLGLMAEAVPLPLLERAVSLLRTVDADGAGFTNVKVEAGQVYRFGTSSLSGLGGQIDQMSEDEARRIMEEAAKGSWMSCASSFDYMEDFPDQVAGLCAWYQADEELLAKLRTAGFLDAASGKEVRWFNALEDLLAETWPERTGELSERPKRRGFLYSYRGLHHEHPQERLAE